jgi:hypothetical protein
MDDIKIIAGFSEGWVGADLNVDIRTARIKNKTLSL